MSTKFRQMKMHTLWSAPVADQFQTVTGQPSLRGRASGVSLSSIHPCRLALDTLSSEWQATSRIMHTMVSIGQIDIQVVAIYGLTSSQPQAAKVNADLVLHAIQATNCLSLPALILGDFNANPFDLNCAATLQQQGFQDLKWACRSLYGKPFPFACRDVTSPDTALISSSLLPLLNSIQVRPDFIFDTHKPVILGFTIDTKLLSSHRMPLPKTWMDLPIEPGCMQPGYQTALRQSGVPTTLEEWGTTVEQAVDNAYRRSQQIHNGCPISHTQALPKDYRGHCKPRSMQAVAHKSLTKLARPGDYNPTAGIYRFNTLRCVKQVGRVQSFRRRLQHPVVPQQAFELRQEWIKICKDKAFGGCFARWCQSHPDIGPLPFTLPSYDFVWHLEQLLRHETDILVARDAQIWRKKQEFYRHLDGKHQVFSMAFAQLKAKPHAMLSAIRIPAEAEVCVVPEESQAVMYMETDHGFQPNQIAYFPRPSMSCSCHR